VLCWLAGGMRSLARNQLRCSLGLGVGSGVGLGMGSGVAWPRLKLRSGFRRVKAQKYGSCCCSFG
jgi:hypothetical protein